LIIALYSAAGLLVLLIVVGLCLPTTYSVQATQTVSAPRERVHVLIADLEQWEHWKPWREKDPTFEFVREQTVGIGAKQSWTD